MSWAAREDPGPHRGPKCICVLTPATWKLLLLLQRTAQAATDTTRREYILICTDFSAPLSSKTNDARGLRSAVPPASVRAAECWRKSSASLRPETSAVHPSAADCAPHLSRTCRVRASSRQAPRPLITDSPSGP